MSGISKIEWDYCEKTPEIGRAWVYIVARHDFSIPSWMKENAKCRIEITTDKEESYYQSTIWWFNRGVQIVGKDEEIRNIFECVKLTDTRIDELFNLFRNEKQS